jgi:hypothetical protein
MSELLDCPSWIANWGKENFSLGMGKQIKWKVSLISDVIAGRFVMTTE